MEKYDGIEQIFLPPNFWGEPESDNAKILKETLKSLNIVTLADKPPIFDSVVGDGFYLFISKYESKYDIPTNFVGIDNNNKFNARTEKLLEKLQQQKSPELCRLIDYLIYDKYWLTLDSDSDRNAFLEALEKRKSDIPIKNKEGQYIFNNEDNEIVLYEEKDVQEYKKYFIEQKDDSHYKDYVKALGVMTPQEFLHNNEWFGKIKSNLKFAFFLFKNYKEKVPNKNDFALFLIDQLDTEQRTDILSFLFESDLITEVKREVMLKPEELIEYGKTINKLECSIFKLDGKERNKDSCIEVIKDIYDELKFVDDIEEILAQEKIVLCEAKSKDNAPGYTQLAEDKLYLWYQKDQRRYRECISKFIKDYFDINLDKRSYTMTSIDTDYSIEVSEITDEDFSNLKIDIKWDELEIEDQKRLLMEPYYFCGKVYPGYARTCPLCNKQIVTEISTMRIKSVYEDKNDSKSKYDFICCSSCADLFYYCEGQPVVNIYYENHPVENKLYGLQSIDSSIELDFYISPNYLYKPYKVKFKPKPLHRKIMITQNGGYENV